MMKERKGSGARELLAQEDLHQIASSIYLFLFVYSKAVEERSLEDRRSRNAYECQPSDPIKPHGVLSNTEAAMWMMHGREISTRKERRLAVSAYESMDALSSHPWIIHAKRSVAHDLTGHCGLTAQATASGPPARVRSVPLR